MAERLREMLKELYGIESGQDLDRAIEQQQAIDISIFCVKGGQMDGTGR